MRQLLIVAFLMTASPAGAQVFEVSAGIGRGCIGSEGGLCGDDKGRVLATHASVWLDDRLELGVRFATLGLRDQTYFIAHDSRFEAADDPAARQLPRIDVASRNRSRRILNGDVLYHFQRGRPVRILLGLGFGRRWDLSTETCTPAGCERIMAILSSGGSFLPGAHRDIAIVTGLSSRVRQRVEIRGGVRLHNFAGEGTSTAELFIATGYRLGRRR